MFEMDMEVNNFDNIVENLSNCQAQSLVHWILIDQNNDDKEEE